MRKVILFLSSLLVLLIMTSCSKNKLDVKVLDATLNEQFIYEHTTYGAYYKYNVWNEEEQKYIYELLIDETSPEEHIIVLSNMEETGLIFESVPSVDFEKNNVIIYCYTTVYGHREKIIKESYIEDNILYITFVEKMPRPGVGDASMPGTSHLIVSVKKDNFDQVKIKVE